MLTFQQQLNQRPSPFATKKSTQPLQEGLELSAADLIDELTAPMAKSISATVVADNDEELTIYLTVKKWNGATNKTADSFAPHPDTAQTNACATR